MSSILPSFRMAAQIARPPDETVPSRTCHSPHFSANPAGIGPDFDSLPHLFFPLIFG
jgi:hypothetical protein